MKSLILTLCLISANAFAQGITAGPANIGKVLSAMQDAGFPIDVRNAISSNNEAMASTRNVEIRGPVRATKEAGNVYKVSFQSSEVGLAPNGPSRHPCTTIITLSNGEVSTRKICAQNGLRNGPRGRPSSGGSNPGEIPPVGTR